MIRWVATLVAVPMRRALLLLLPAAVLVAAGCGGKAEPGAHRATAAGAPTDAQVRNALELPDRVPLRATGSAPADEVAVVRAWLDELRAGHVVAAARRFGLPARFQNFTAIALIHTRRQALAVTSSLPCGARMTRAGGANGFVVYEARLTERPGGACGAGTGGIVRGAVLVRGGHMLEWYRLPDRSRPRRGERVIPSGPLV
jgi:hypothetical protein